LEGDQEDKSDETLKDLIKLFDYASMLKPSSNLDEPPQYADRIHRMVKLGSNIVDDDEDASDADDLPPLEEVEGAAVEASTTAEAKRQGKLGALKEFVPTATEG